MIDYSEFRQWMDTLYRHPEWREELRRVVLTDEILELPKVLDKTAEIVQQTVIAVQELIEAHKRGEERLKQVEIAIAELAEAQKRTEQRVEELAQAQKRTESG